MIPADDTEKSTDRRAMEQRQEDSVRGAEARESALSDHDLLINLGAEVRHLTREMDIFMARADSSYVTRAEFTPVKIIAFGFVTLVMTGIIGALLALLIKGK